MCEGAASPGEDQTIVSLSFLVSPEISSPPPNLDRNWSLQQLIRSTKSVSVLHTDLSDANMDMALCLFPGCCCKQMTFLKLSYVHVQLLDVVIRIV